MEYGEREDSIGFINIYKTIIRLAAGNMPLLSEPTAGKQSRKVSNYSKEEEQSKSGFSKPASALPSSSEEGRGH